MSSLYLIDVSALAYRSFYAFIHRPLVNSRGEESSAVFGFVSAILRLIKECQPSHIAFVKDLKGPTWRHETYAEYKAHRKPMPDSLAAQLPAIDDFVDHCGLRTVSLPGYEADDVMATLATLAKQTGMKTYLVTRDKDLMQLVGDSVFLYEQGKQGQEAQVIGSAEVKAKFGIGPEHIIDFLSLLGDASDNVPGVKGIGEKGAVSLIEQFGSLDGIYQHLADISRPKLRETLEREKENAYLSQKLVTLHCGLELPLGLSDLGYQGLDVERVRQFIQRWEINSVLKFLPSGNEKQVSAQNKHPLAPTAPVSTVKKSETLPVSQSESLGKATPASTPSLSVSPVSAASGLESETLSLFESKPQVEAIPHHYTLVCDETGLKEMCQALEASTLLAVDTETTSLNVYEADLVGICLAMEAHRGYYVSIAHEVGQNVPLELVQQFLLPLFNDPQRGLIFHNARYDLAILDKHGLKPTHLDTPGHLLDTLIAAYVGNPGERGHSLDELAQRYFGHNMIPIESLIGKGKTQIPFSRVAQTEACEYGAEDADYTWQLWQVLSKDIKAKQLYALFHEMEMPLLPVLIAMEKRGILVDLKGLKALGKHLDEALVDIEKQVHAQVGHAFNLASPNQLAQVLYVELGLKQGRKTKTGFSTDADTLEKLADQHPIVPLILEHREFSKLRGTYVEALPQQAHTKTGRVHTTFSQTIAATGRLSSVNPNLQNIPVRTELGKEIRRCFIAPEGRRLLCADYSQIELRLLAHISQDPELLRAYREGLDIHTRTAAAIYGLAENDVTSDMRRNAKTVNFGVLYGMGPQRLSQQLKIPRSEASRFIENYFRTYAKVNTYVDTVVEKGRREGYVETLAGRRRYLPDLLSDNRMLRENAERIAVNSPIQGSAADLIKIAMIRIDHQLQKNKLPCSMLLQVHDELVFEIDTDAEAEASQLIRREMIGAMQLDVPLEVGIGSGQNWLEAHS